MTARRGFSVAELLVVCAVVAILTALTVVGLRAARGRVSEVDEVSCLRQTLTDFFTWSADHDGRWPTFGLPKHGGIGGAYGWVDPGSPNAEEQMASFYMGARIAWTNILYGWKGHDEPYWYGADGVDLSLFGGPGGTGNQVAPVLSRYRYSATLRTRPDLWVWPGRGRLISYTEQVSIWGEEVRVSQVRSPAMKGVPVYDPLSYESLRNGLRGRDPGLFVGFADGGARMRSRAEAKPTAEDPSAVVRGPGEPVLATLYGYEGVDF